MKVGLFIGDTESKKGDEYTFLVQLLAAFERRMGQNTHELVLCQYGCSAIANQFPRLTAIDLKRRKQRVLYWWECLFDIYPEFLERAYHRILRFKLKPRWDERVSSKREYSLSFGLLPFRGTTFRTLRSSGTLHIVPRSREVNRRAEHR